MDPEDIAAVDSKVVGLPKMRAAASVRPGSLNEETRTVTLVATTGARVLRGYYDQYYEELEISKKAIRMGRMNSGAPLLNSHLRNNLGDVIGVVEKAYLKDDQLMVDVRFSNRADVEPYYQDVRDGIIRNCSIGYNINKFVQTDLADDEIPVYTAVDWEPFEVSMVPVGADATAGVRAEADDEKNPCIFMKRGAAVAKPEALKMEKTPEEIAAEKAALAATRAAEDAKIREQAIADENKRLSEIRQLCRAAKLSEEDSDGLLEPGKTVDQARDFVLRKLIEGQGPETQTASATKVKIGEDHAREGFREGVTNALLARANPGSIKVTEAGRQFAGMTMIEMARDYCDRVLGLNVRGMRPWEIAGYVLNDTRAGLHTTSDFPLLLADVAHKQLRASYEKAEQTWRPLATQSNLPDFKSRYVTQFGEAPQLLLVNEHGEFKRGTVGEAREAYKLATYGRIVGVSRQLLINDDLDALTDIPAAFGMAAADLESDIVWAQITANPLMGDGIALFEAATHKNLTASGTVISVQSLGVARALMRQQRGIDGKQYLNVRAKYLVVPAALETVSDQFMSATTPNQNTQVNPFARTLTTIVEPRLDVASATAWYTFADPARLPVLTFGYLDGQEGPQIDTRYGFDIDGMEIKCRLDFASKVLDWRGAYKNNGA